MTKPTEHSNKERTLPRSIRAVTFDVTGTLIRCPQRAALYGEVLDRHGIALSEQVRAALPATLDVVWQEMACRAHPERDRFSNHAGGARGFWRSYLERVCALLALPEPSPFAAAELFHVFGKGVSWELFDDAVPALAALRDQGFRLAVISNWDDRLGGLLADLAVDRYFTTVVTSADLGCEKPDPRLFLHAVDALGVAPAEALHVGDRALEDVEGAEAAGLRAWRVDRAAGHGLGAVLEALTDRSTPKG